MKRKFLMVWLASQLTTLTVCRAQGETLPLPSADLARLLGFADTWKIRDMTSAERERLYPHGSAKVQSSLVASHELVLAEGSSAAIRVSVANAGVLWDEKWRQTLRDYPAAYKELVNSIKGLPGVDDAYLKARTLQRFDYKPHGIAVAGPQWTGPGGGGRFTAIAHLPGLNLDVAIRLMYSESALENLSETDRAAIAAFESQFTTKSVAALTSVASRASGNALQATPAAWDAELPIALTETRPAPSLTNATVSPATIKSDKQSALPLAAEPAPATKPAQSTAYKPWLLALGLASLAVMAWFFLKGRGP